MKDQSREIRLIRFKRVHIHPFSNDKAGHWWFEIGDPTDKQSESYGWWPNSNVDSLWTCLHGVEGKLNNGLSDSNPPRDPHHGEQADEEFFPCVSADDKRPEREIAKCLKQFALEYSGKWQWFFGFGDNCHYFQNEALKHCGLIIPKRISKRKL